MERIFPEIDFFKNKNIKKLVTDILTVYCQKNKELSYRQGMHEILAIIIYVVTKEYKNKNLNLFDQHHIEHDSYHIFSELMKILKDWFIVKDDKKSELLIKLENMMNLLKECNLEIYDILSNNKIEPQLFALRWYRLLFSREFKLNDIMVIWDRILHSYYTRKSMKFTDCFAICLILYQHNEIIENENDQSFILSKLLRLPKIDSNIIIDQSLKLLKAENKREISYEIINQNYKLKNKNLKITPAAKKTQKEGINPTIQQPEHISQKGNLKNSSDRLQTYVVVDKDEVGLGNFNSISIQEIETQTNTKDKAEKNSQKEKEKSIQKCLDILNSDLSNKSKDQLIYIIKTARDELKKSTIIHKTNGQKETAKVPYTYDDIKQINMWK